MLKFFLTSSASRGCPSYHSSVVKVLPAKAGWIFSARIALVKALTDQIADVVANIGLSNPT